MSKPVFEGIFRFSGRRNRKSYILLSLVFTLWFAPIAFLFHEAKVAPVLILFAALLLVPLAWASMAAHAQRLRDCGLSGWLALTLLIPFLGWGVAVALLLVRGMRGENRYGPDPLLRDDAFDAAPGHVGLDRQLL